NAGTPFDDLTVDTAGTYQLLAQVPENLPGPTPATTGDPPGFGVISQTFIGTTPPPNPPSITSSTATTAQQIVLNWDGATRVNNKGKTVTDKSILRYHIFRAPGVVTPPSALFAEIDEASTSSLCGGSGSFTPCQYTDLGPLSDGTQYTY